MSTDSETHLPYIDFRNRDMGEEAPQNFGISLIQARGVIRHVRRAWDSLTCA